jgi:GT2 family glycosyltransferase
MPTDVVVVNYQTPDLLEDFTRSFEAYCSAGDTLTIVDVCPTRPLGTAHFTVATEENIGFARACNVGARFGPNDVILFANADTLLSDGLGECGAALMEHPGWAVLGPRQVDAMGRITSAGTFGSETQISPRGWQEYDDGQYNQVQDDAKSVSGSLYFIKRAVWDEMCACPLYQQAAPEAAGAFLPTPHYFEETFLSYHVRAHGYKVVYYGPVQMVHYWHRSSPHNGWADNQFNTSQMMMREACAIHGIICE